MLASVLTGAAVGLDCSLVEVQVDLAQGLPNFTVVGLPDTAVQEARERVRAAVRNSGYPFPMKRVTVNLAPAEVRKEGAGFDLPIALGVLAAAELVRLPQEPVLFFGELSLDGAARHTKGILPMVALAREQRIPTVVVPAVDAQEAGLVDGAQIIPAPSLAALVQHLNGECPIASFVASGPAPRGDDGEDDHHDLADVRGQEHAKRALEVAAAGGHNLLLNGPPGTGKTLLARCLPSILPPLTLEEALELSKIYSISGLLRPEEPLARRRPFRAPHHTISHAGLVGGGPSPRPGELSLAHHGVLFLDELPEFGHRALETLRQPLESGVVTISRASGALTFPARVTLVAAMNPCPCGYYGDTLRRCTCDDGTLRRYRRRLSGPLLDRIDMHLDVPRIPYDKLAVELAELPPAGEAGAAGPTVESSATVRRRVVAARERQRARLQRSGLRCNAEMGPAEVSRFCRPQPEAAALLHTAMRRLQLSARAYHRVLKLARTIADLAEAEVIGVTHVAEALQYRPRSPDV
ncbi:MAG TPA: YifB family Mg chelatase-like AAA ATPase [Chloroflexota bacterium]|nr:YifB family Mg chelatase-like AAA ATPase [Chloroflexota bacterium]